MGRSIARRAMSIRRATQQRLAARQPRACRIELKTGNDAKRLADNPRVHAQARRQANGTDQPGESKVITVRQNASLPAQRSGPEDRSPYPWSNAARRFRSAVRSARLWAMKLRTESTSNCHATTWAPPRPTVTTGKSGCRAIQRSIVAVAIPSAIPSPCLLAINPYHLNERRRQCKAKISSGKPAPYRARELPAVDQAPGKDPWASGAMLPAVGGAGCPRVDGVPTWRPSTAPPRGRARRAPCRLSVAWPVMAKRLAAVVPRRAINPRTVLDAATPRAVLAYQPGTPPPRARRRRRVWRSLFQW